VTVQALLTVVSSLAMKTLGGRRVLAFILFTFDVLPWGSVSATPLPNRCTCKLPPPCSCATLLDTVPCFAEQAELNSCSSEGRNISKMCQVQSGQCSKIELLCEEKHAICSSGMVLLPHIAVEIKPDNIKRAPSTKKKKILTESVPVEAQQITYNSQIPDWDAFLARPDEKSFAVGKLTDHLASRPWAAVWNHWTQKQADVAAIAACERMAPKCRVAWPLRKAGQGKAAKGFLPKGFVQRIDDDSSEEEIADGDLAEVSGDIESDNSHGEEESDDSGVAHDEDGDEEAGATREETGDVDFDAVLLEMNDNDVVGETGADAGAQAADTSLLDSASGASADDSTVEAAGSNSASAQSSEDQFSKQVEKEEVDIQA